MRAQLSKFSGMLPSAGTLGPTTPKIPIPPTPKAGKGLGVAGLGTSPAQKGAAAVAKKAVTIMGGKPAAGAPDAIVQPPPAQDAKRLKTDAAGGGAPVPV